MDSMDTSRMEVNTINSETNILSVNKCVFCNMSLNENSKLLDCLHVICSKCLEKTTNSIVHCKCLAVTNGELINFPKPPTTCTTNACNTVANQICIRCIQFYCQPCSKVHLNIANDHFSNSIQSYVETPTKCLQGKCVDGKIDMYCTECSILMCCMCFLESHKHHKYKHVKDLNKKIKINLSQEKNDLKKYIDKFDICLSKTEQHVSQLGNLKTLVYKQIDSEMDKLHKEIDNRTIELKKKINDHYLDFVKTINENNSILQDIQNKNKYYVGVIDYIMKHDNNLYEIENVSKMVINKLKSTKHHTSSIASKVELKLEADFGFKRTQSLADCISNIKEVGSIDPYPISSLSNIITSKNQKPIQLHNTFNTKNVKVENATEMKHNKHSFDLPFVMCVCCELVIENTEGIICDSCKRQYHFNCHIPVLNKNIKSIWTCTMCVDSTTYSKVLKINTTIGLNELTIIHRILMELYCYGSMHVYAFRDCPRKDLFIEYYKYVRYPISLNDVTKRLRSSGYKSVIHAIKDLYQVFLNPKLYYSPNHPDHQSARKMLIFLNKMLGKWIPKLNKTKIQSDIILNFQYFE